VGGWAIVNVDADGLKRALELPDVHLVAETNSEAMAQYIVALHDST
jgi:hypothetical protein